MKEWTRQELSDYISGFTNEQRDNVLKAILESELLEKAFSTTDGKLILNGFVEMIRDETMSIVRGCMDKDKSRAKILEKIDQSAKTIAIAYQMMHNYATILAKGDEHNARVKLVKK